MSKQTQKYYPVRDESTQDKPASCLCGLGDFKTISGTGKTRYLCKNCKTTYFVDSPEKQEQKLKSAGSIFDNIAFGMSTREASLRTFVDWGTTVSHATILNWSEKHNKYAKMFTDDILCCLEYGTRWGIDETVIDIRGKNVPADEKYIKEIDELGKTTKNQAEYKKQWEKIRQKQVKSGKSPNKIYLTGIIDIKTRVIIHYIITEKRPNHKEIYKLLRVAVTVAGVPKIITTDCYKAYGPAVKQLQDRYPKFEKIKHIQNRAKNQSTLNIPAGNDGATPRNNNTIESTWSKLKRNMDMLSRYESNFEGIIAFIIMRYNFIRPHSGIGKKTTIMRHDTNLDIDLTPAMAGGYPLWFANFFELFREAWGYDKSFIFKMNPELVRKIKIGIRNKNTVVISTKPGVTEDESKKIDRTLATCGFVNMAGRNEWKRQIASISNMNRRRTAKLGIAPAQTFEVCHRCGLLAVTSQEISEKIGYRKIKDKVITQPNCTKCRSHLSSNPKNPTGKNKIAMKFRKGQQRIF